MSKLYKKAAYFLEILWIALAVYSAVMLIYTYSRHDYSNSMAFALFLVIASGMYYFRRKRRLERQNDLE